MKRVEKKAEATGGIQKFADFFRLFCTVQSRFSDIKFIDNLWFSDYFAKTIFKFMYY